MDIHLIYRKQNRNTGWVCWKGITHQGTWWTKSYGFLLRCAITQKPGDFRM